MTNPQNLAYWAALGSALGALGVSNPSMADYALFFAGFMIASVLWAIFCAAAIHKVFHKAGHQWVVLTYRLCAVMFLVLALNTVRGLFSHMQADELPVQTHAPAPDMPMVSST